MARETAILFPHLFTNPLIPFLVILLSVGFIVYNSRTDSLPKGTRLPHGPPGKPIVGNLADIPTKHFWLRFKAWADKYGPLYSLNLMGSSIVVVSTEKIANDLLRERGNLYSSRPQLPMGGQLISRNLRIILLPYGELWRRERRFMHHLTMPKAAASYEPLQIYESERLLYNLLRDPSNYERSFEHYSSAVIMRLNYGKTVETSGEPYVRRIVRIVHEFERVLSPGAYLVDTFPSLLWLPRWLAPFKREAEALHEEEVDVFRGLLLEVKKKMQRGNAPKCFARTFWEKQDEHGLTDDQGAYLFGSLFEAGTGTTAAAMMSFCLAMCHYPEWQARAQEEVDAVVGNGRLPTYDDMESLPTVRAVAKETLRWRPVTAGGVPHELIKDDVYDGYFLRAGTNVHPNQWAIHREAALYPDPETFNPERWLSSKYPTYREPLTRYPNLQNFSAFGFGRRICPALNIAERSLHLLVARIAWACHLSKRPGHDIPWYDYTAHVNSQPKTFVFDLVARDEKRSKFVQETWAKGQARDPLAM